MSSGQGRMPLVRGLWRRPVSYGSLVEIDWVKMGNTLYKHAKEDTEVCTQTLAHTQATARTHTHAHARMLGLHTQTPRHKHNHKRKVAGRTGAGELIMFFVFVSWSLSVWPKRACV